MPANSEKTREERRTIIGVLGEPKELIWKRGEKRLGMFDGTSLDELE